MRRLYSPETDPKGVVPHRPPVLCVDRITQTGEMSAMGEVEVRQCHYLCVDDFWEGGLVEGLGQTAAALMTSSLRREGLKPRRGLLARIRGLELSRRARRGERILFHVEIVKKLGSLSLVQCLASCGDEVLARGHMSFFVESGS